MHARIFTALALGLVGFALPAPASAQWTTLATDTLAGTAAGERSTRFSVAIDAADAPHALWSVGSRIYYSRKPAGAWLPPIELSHADANYAALALTVVPGTSRPCVLYSRTPLGAPAGELVLAEWNGSGFDLLANRGRPAALPMGRRLRFAGARPPASPENSTTIIRHSLAPAAATLTNLNIVSVDLLSHNKL